MLPISELQQLAVGTLGTWFNGYTEPCSDGAQRRVSLMDSPDLRDNVLRFKVEDNLFIEGDTRKHDPDRVIEIQINIRERQP